MKKILTSVCAIVLGICAILPLSGFTRASAQANAQNTSVTFTDSEMVEILDKFYEIAGDDRTTYVNERAAAVALDYYFSDLGLNSSVREFTQIESNSQSYASYNVVARLSSENTNAKQVIISACYDNLYADNGVYKGTGSDGAIYSSTSVATVMKIAEHFSKNPVLDFDLVFALYGASTSSYYGAANFLSNLDPEQFANTLYYVEIQMLGCENVYMFSDERSTDIRTYVQNVAAESNTAIKEVPALAEHLPIQVLNGIPYAHAGMMGTFGAFFNQGIPCLNIFGGALDDFNLAFNESAKRDNVIYTANDTRAKLEQNSPDYANQMATAAQLVVSVLSGEDFQSTAAITRANMPDTSLLTMTWIWSLVLVAVIIGLFVLLSFLTSSISKKNPIVMEQPKAVKIPIFGMDYEERDPDTVYIDPKGAVPPRAYDPYGTDSIYSDRGDDSPVPQSDNSPQDVFGLDDDRLAAQQRARDAYYGAVVTSEKIVEGEESEESKQIEVTEAAEESETATKTTENDSGDIAATKEEVKTQYTTSSKSDASETPGANSTSTAKSGAKSTSAAKSGTKSTGAAKSGAKSTGAAKSGAKSTSATKSGAKSTGATKSGAKSTGAAKSGAKSTSAAKSGAKANKPSNNAVDETQEDTTKSDKQDD